MITLNLKDGGLLKISATDIIDYTPTFKGTIVVYSENGENKTAEVYEVVSRIKSMIAGENHE